MTNVGDCLVFSVPELKRQINAAAVRREDISGISSLCFTNHDEALYMMSSSELQRISLSATKIVSVEGTIDLELLNEVEITNDDDDDDTLTEQKSDLEIITEETEQQSKLNPLTVAIDSTTANTTGDSLTNGIESSPNSNNLNDPVTSSLGDITVDSVRDHLNSTITTLHSTTTEVNSCVGLLNLELLKLNFFLRNNFDVREILRFDEINHENKFI